MLPMLGALMVLGGLLFMAVQAIRGGPLSEKRSRAAGTDVTLEPRKPGAGLGLTRNWPGLVLIAAGFIVLIATAGWAS